jgi:hypothetical protein
VTNMSSVVHLLKKEHARLTTQIQGVSAALAAFGASYKNGSGTRGKISAAGRARIAAAQRARWAKVKGRSSNASQYPEGALCPRLLVNVLLRHSAQGGRR